jgi:hypothetical protein
LGYERGKMIPAPLQLNTPDDAALPATGDELVKDEGLSPGEDVNEPAAGEVNTQPPEEPTRTATTAISNNGKASVDTQPYEFDQCTITIGIQLLPADGDPLGRLVVVGVRSHADPPIIRMVRESELSLPEILKSLLAQLAAELPARQEARQAAEAKARADEEARKAKVARTSKPAKPARKKLDLSATPGDAPEQPATPATPAAPPLTKAVQPPAAGPSTDDKPGQFLLFG